MNTQSGRSMVEMLGVLAIIGVLSVGAIAGYSKAMMKYKMNKFSVSLNELLNTSIQYSGKLYSASNYTADASGSQYFANILYKMNALPDGIKYKDNQFLEDIFGNDIWPYGGRSFYGLGYLLGRNGNNKLGNEICHQVINIAKENSSQLWQIYTDNLSTEGDEKNLVLFGDAYCASDVKCLKNVSISDVETMCHYFKGQRSRFYILWK